MDGGQKGQSSLGDLGDLNWVLHHIAGVAHSFKGLAAIWKSGQKSTRPEATWGYSRLPTPKLRKTQDLGWSWMIWTAFVLSEFCLDFFLLFLRAQRTSEFSGLHLGFAWEARQKTHSIKHIPIRFPSDGGLPFGNQRWQWKNHTISLGISQLATFDDNAGYTIGKINSIFSFLNGQPLISAPQTK